MANENYKTWLVRNTPKVTWSASAQEQDAQFSLLLVDAGFGFAHAIYVNIKGGDISKGQVRGILKLSSQSRSYEISTRSRPEIERMPLLHFFKNMYSLTCSKDCLNSSILI